MTLTNNQIVELIGSREAYQTSNDLMAQLMDLEQREALFKRFLCVESDLSYDWFVNFFQMTFSDRDIKKQDYTPRSLSRLASLIAGNTDHHSDICAGSGALTIAQWNVNPDAEFYLEEYSDAVIPFLLFNLSVRNMNAIVRHGDSLHETYKATYRLSRSGQFSNIEKIEEYEPAQSDTVIMNPPFSMKWTYDKKTMSKDPRFVDYGLAPKSKSDYAFLLQGLSKLSDTGTLVSIMSPGILFRGNAEGTIRESLIKHNLIDTIIQLPSNAFLKTTTPTIMVVLKKQRTNSDILVIDASKECEVIDKYNVITDKHINRIIDVISNRQDVKKLAHVATLEEVESNEYNLNVSRYVDTFDEEPQVDLAANWRELQQTEAEIQQTNAVLKSMVAELRTDNPALQTLLSEIAI